MRFLRSNTAVIVTVGPFYDKADGVTIETSLTITNERITLTADTDAGSAPTNILDNVTGATAGTANDLNYITGNDAGMMQLELAAADVNRVGRMFLSITDAANHVPVFHEFFVLPQAIYDWLTGAIVPLPANITQIDGQATSGNNATLNLKQLNIVNSAGSALVASSTGGNGHGINASGNGSGEGLSATGGATGHGIEAQGGATSGAGIRANGGALGEGFGAYGGTTGAGMICEGRSNKGGFECYGHGSEPGIYVEGGDAGNGIEANSGFSGGHGIHAWSNADGDGFRATCFGSNGHGAGFVGGGTSGDGINASAPGSGDGFAGSLAPSTLASFFDTNSGETFASAVAGSVVKEIVDNAGGGSAPTAGEIADAVWDEDATGHQTQGTFGQAIGDPAADANTIYGAVVTGAAGATVAADIIAIKAETASILTDTAEIGAAGAGLTNINLPNQTMDIVGNITGNVSGSVGSVTGAVGSVTAGVTLANDAITAAKFDETTAFPLVLADTGATAVARTGTDADTLETLSDQLDTKASQASVDDLPTNAELATSQAAADDATLAAIAALNNLSAAQVNSEVDSALADARLDELLAADSDIDGAAPPAVGSVFHELLTKTPGSFTYDQTTDSLEAVRDNMGTPQTGDSFARLGLPAGASVSADIAAIEAQTDDIGVAGAGLTAVPWNAAWDAQVESEVADAIAVYDPPTHAELVSEVNAVQADIAALNNLSAAQVNAEVDTALTDIHLDHLLAVTYDPASKPGAADALLNELVESDAGVARYTANALEEAPTGGSAPTVQEIVDGVWDETLADHLDAGSTGAGLNAAGSAGDPWSTAIPGAYGAGTAGKIVGDNLNATVSSRATQTSVDDIPTNAELATALGTADDAVLAAIAALNNLSMANIRTAVGLGSANLDTQLGDLPTNAELTAALASADDAVLAAIAALNNLSQANIRTAVGLASANLDTQLDALPTNADLATALASADDAVLAAIAALNNLSAAEVNAQVVDALATDTYPEPVAVPPATASLSDKINWLAALARNRVTQTSTTQTLRNDADSADIATAAVSDDGSEFVRAEWT